MVWVIMSLLWHFLVQYPVYFAFEDDDIDAVLADVKRSDVSGQPATATTGGLVPNFIMESENSG